MSLRTVWTLSGFERDIRYGIDHTADVVDIPGDDFGDPVVILDRNLRDDIVLPSDNMESVNGVELGDPFGCRPYSAWIDNRVDVRVRHVCGRMFVTQPQDAITVGTCCRVFARAESHYPILEILPGNQPFVILGHDGGPPPGLVGG